MSNLSTFIKQSSGSPSHSNQTRNKSIQIRKVVVNISPFAEDIILYIENPKDSSKTLQELINEFSRIDQYAKNKSIKLTLWKLQVIERNLKRPK